MTSEIIKNNQASRLYKESGVDIDKAEKLVDWLRDSETSRTTKFGSHVDGVGGFAALFRPDFSSLEKPLLVTGTDGVGTKVLLAAEHSSFEGLGQDLVAMCVNDLYTIGARPLFFLDYYATGELEQTQFKQVLTGIKKALSDCDALLLGGETAEMPGLYGKGHFDLAGFIVGCVDEPKALGPQRVKDGDSLYAIQSSGFHSNGFSLIRKWLGDKKQDQSVIEHLLQPTKLYYEIPQLVEELGVEILHSAANITGGGISGNLPRVMPIGAQCTVSIEKLPIQQWAREFIESNGADLMDVESTFNLGCGMIISVDGDEELKVESLLDKLGLKFSRVGHVEIDSQSSNKPTVNFVN